MGYCVIVKNCSYKDYVEVQKKYNLIYILVLKYRENVIFLFVCK